MRILFSLFVCLSLFAACGDGTVSADAEKAAMEASLQAQQSAYDAMMEGHDRVMPLMGNITASQKAIKAKLDAGEFAEGEKDLLIASFEQLEDANDGMMEWMGDIKTLDDLRGSMDSDGILKYVKEQAADIAKVEMDMKAAIGNAKELVGDHSGHDHDGHDHDGHDHSGHSH